MGGGGHSKEGSDSTRAGLGIQGVCDWRGSQEGGEGVPERRAAEGDGRGVPQAPRLPEL